MTFPKPISIHIYVIIVVISFPSLCYVCVSVGSGQLVLL